MIPWVVARELRATLLDYLRSTWALGDPREEAALFEFLAGRNGIFQGPYLRIALPFTEAPKDAAVPLDVAPNYPPHLHQLQAWQRLSSRGQTPRATLITTGTGSGKTECFLYPVLDHVHRAVQRGERGIKAIILYPMNALAGDQAQRFGDAIWKQESLRGRVRVGLFIGGKGQHHDMGRDHVVDVNDRLRHDPPDILLTNYRMLDLLLQRPKDAPLWAHNGPNTLRYLVLDELHTYDGAQGTDVACLIRRLGKRLGNPDAICPVGTSATVGGGGDTRAELLRFAATLFDQPFPDDAFIGETRVEPDEFFPDPMLEEQYPESPGPWPGPGDDAESHVRTAIEAWLPAKARKEILAKGPIDRVALGRWVRRVPIVRQLIAAAHRRPIVADEVVSAVARELPSFSAASAAHREGWFASALSMLSYAQREAAGFAMPLVSVQATLWIREVRRLLSRVGEQRAYRFYDEAPPPPEQAWLPQYACQHCGHTGWLIAEAGPGQTLSFDYRVIARAYRERASTLRLLHRDDSLDNSAARDGWIDARARRILEKDPQSDAPKVFVVDPGGAALRCPACYEPDTARMLAARGTTLSSVAVGHLFTTPLNTDRKLLTFSDSVQDAAHRAGFFGARTYRFVVRSALLAVVPHQGTIKLGDLGARVWDHWSEKLGVPDAAATLLPPDLHWLASVEDWHALLDDHARRRRDAEKRGESLAEPTPPPLPALIADLTTRLQWEGARELGVAARIGRTLEQSGCLSVTVDRDRFDRAVASIAEQLPEKLGVFTGCSAHAVRAWVAGVLTRLRIRGGVLDPLLQGYVVNGGKGFLLTKKMNPLMSPFPPQTSRPLFITNAPKARKFDSIASTRKQSWAIDWLSRALGVDVDPGTSATAYGALIPFLVREGILAPHPTNESAGAGKATAWGLVPEVLHVSRAHVFRCCDTCGYELAAVEQSVTDPIGSPCLRYRCKGHFRALDARDSWDEAAGLPSSTYYRQTYERGQLGRLWSREHTGLLERSAREDLELEFKQRPRPDSPNLLSCTPTLEMGIDIGDLSATLLCSVPPGTANYVQRVGRAGRKTGNALVLAFAATRAHDLYFFQQPLEAMAGAIHPPGCYLSAPEVLKRQALAFCFDCFARDGGKMPGSVGDALRGEEAKRFPGPILEFIAPKRSALRDAFLEMFPELTVTARAKMQSLFEQEADGVSPIERRLRDATEATQRRREDLRKLAQKIGERRKQLDTDEVEAKKVADLEDEKRRLSDEYKFVGKQLKLLMEQDLWGWLCEESILPNYAFPERGVKLDAFIRREGNREPEHYEWVRAPAAALRELAPFNTFYASSRRVPITGVELKRDTAPVEWSFCASCHHAEPRSTTATNVSACPRCNDTRFVDVGQRRSVLLMGQVYAIASHRDAVLGDDADDRQREYYETLALFEAEAEAREAWANDAAGFGFELQPRLVLRELNLGLRDDATNPQTVTIAGQPHPDVRFELCAVCGQAQRAPANRPSDREEHRHRGWCPERKKPIDKQSSRQIALLRELRSEALRLVVPISDAEDTTSQLANVRAALRLGLRRSYGGEPDFLDVRTYDEPLAGQEGRRRYLVVMDRVPGGTGLLAELVVNKGAKLKEALEHAHTALRECECRTRSPAVRACYQCLYAYREGEDLPLLDRQRAIELVERLHDAFATLNRVDTVGAMTQSSVLESELEHRFVVAMKTRIEGDGGTFTHVDEGGWKLQVGKRRWLLRAQVPLGADRVAYPCRADFVLYPEEQERAVRPIAVFTDGLAYHVAPGAPDARLADDAMKRQGISVGGTMLSWSLTWKDVVSPDTAPVPCWFGEGAPLLQLQGMAAKLGEPVQSTLRVLDSDPVRGLLAVLGAPLGLDKLARITAFGLLQRGRRQRAAHIEQAHERWRSSPDAGTLGLEEATGEVIAAVVPLGGHASLLLDVAGARLGSLIKEKEGPRLTLRLEDDAGRRADANYETSWRMWLRAWNLLQVLPGAAFTTRDAAAAELAPPSRREAAAQTAVPAGDERMRIVAELIDAEAQVVIRDLLQKHPSLDAPAVPLELRAGGIHGDLELGWPDRKVAAYFDAQKATADALVASGWTVFSIERKLELAALEQALGLSKG